VLVVSPSSRTQNLAHLDGPKQRDRHHRPKREDRYHRTALDDMRLGDVTTEQLQHYLGCRRHLEQHLDEESVFDEIVRLAAQADDETTDLVGFTNRCRARKLAHEATVGVDKERLAKIAFGMLRDGWSESQVAYALGTLRSA